MYFVEVDKIEKQLTFLEKQLIFLKESRLEKGQCVELARERAMVCSIEAMFDVANGMIDGFIMRDPGSYEDIIDIFVDEKVISATDGDLLKHVVTVRKLLVQQYWEQDKNEVEQLWSKAEETLTLYPKHVRNYLTLQNVVVNAFRN